MIQDDKQERRSISAAHGRCKPVGRWIQGTYIWIFKPQMDPDERRWAMEGLEFQQKWPHFWNESLIFSKQESFRSGLPSFNSSICVHLSSSAVHFPSNVDALEMDCLRFNPRTG
jgi:hypothetical protein